MNPTWLALGLALVAPVAQAAETGNLAGKVTDEAGQPLSGALVRVSGAQIGTARDTTTGADGRFELVALPPGRHTLEVAFGGYQPALTEVVIRLDETAYLPILLGTAGEVMEITVEGTQPVIDATRSAISTELDATTLANLPVGRSFQDAVNMLPGIYGRVDTEGGGPGSGNPSVRGEGAYGNNYFIDGISTRDPATKTFGADVNFDAIEAIQVYTDGAPAEFSQATGMVVNVVTKDGGDEHHGSVGYYLSMNAGSGTYDVLDLDKGREVPTEKRKFMVHELATTSGGPLIKEKLWYFVALTAALDRTDYEGASPEAPYRGQSLAGFGKLTWFVTPDLSLQYEANGSNDLASNYLTSSLIAPSAQARYLSSQLAHITTLRWRPAVSNELEWKASYLPLNLTVEPMSDDTKAPLINDVDSGRVYGNHDSVDENVRSRLGTSLKYTHLVPRAAGSHRLKFGVEQWILRDARELTYTGPGGGLSYAASPDQGFPCQEPDGSDCYGKTVYDNVGAPLGHRGNLFGAFAQDDWKPVPTLTFNLGARVDREVLFQNEGDKVIDAWMFAPRTGMAWDATGDSRTLVSFNAGRYYDLAGNDFAAWGDTKSSYSYKQFINDGNGGWTKVWEQDPEQDPLVYCTDDSLQRFEKHLVSDYGFTPRQASAERRLADKTCGGRLKPYHLDKLTLAVEREVAPLLAIGARGILSVTQDLPEDVNLNDTTWVITNPDVKFRNYQALELTLEKKADERWSALASYTLSASRGHAPGQFEMSTGSSFGSSGNDVGVYLDDVNDPKTRDLYHQYGYSRYLNALAGLGTQQDPAGYYGFLPYHSFHQVKLNGYYHFPFGTTFGLVYEFDSGHAWQRKGYVPAYFDYSAFPEGRGTRFMPAVHYVDVRAAHTVRLREQELELVLDVFNVLDLEAPITYYENDNALFGQTLYRQSPRAVRAGLRFRY